MESRTEYTIKRLGILNNMKANVISFPAALIVALIAVKILLSHHPVGTNNVMDVWLVYGTCFVLIWIPMLIISLIVSGAKSKKCEKEFRANPELVSKYILSDKEKRPTDKDRSLIKRTYIKAKLGIWFLVAIIPVFVLGSVGMIVMDFSMGGHTDQKYLICTWIAVFCICLIGMIYCYVSCRMSNLGDKWDKILQKASPYKTYTPLEKEKSLAIAGTAAGGRLLKRADHETAGSVMEAAAGISAGAFLISQLNAIADQAKAISPTFGVKMPNIKRIGILIVISLCAVVMVALVHDWNYNTENKLRAESVIKARITQIDKTFVEHGGRTHYIFSGANQSSDVRGYLEKDGYDAYVSLSVQPSTDITEAVYCLKADKALSKEEALKKMLTDYRGLRKILKDIDMDKRLRTNYNLTDEFKNDFYATDEWITLSDNPDKEDKHAEAKYYSLESDGDIEANACFEADFVDGGGNLWIFVKFN